jgi:hypothetical protein
VTELPFKEQLDDASPSRARITRNSYKNRINPVTTGKLKKARDLITIVIPIRRLECPLQQADLNKRPENHANADDAQIAEQTLHDFMYIYPRCRGAQNASKQAKRIG